jgi:hypothetical protein
LKAEQNWINQTRKTDTIDSVESTPMVHFLYRKVWSLESEVQFLNFIRKVK